MQRNPTIINLYDPPLYPRPSYSSRHLKPIQYPRPVLSWLVVAAALLYCAVYLMSGLSERRPGRSQPAAPMRERADAVPILRAPEAPAPDMASQDVRFAEADADISHANPATPPKIAASTPQKKKKVHVVARPKEEEPGGRQTYAFRIADHRTHDIGGF